MSAGVVGPARSLLYVPGDREGWVDKALRSDADALIIDLEDAVAPAKKDVARRLVGEAVAAAPPPGRAAAIQLWVRIDSASVDADLEAVVAGRLHTVVVPKAEPDLLAHVAARLDALEAERELPTGAVGVLALMETAGGIDRVREVAASPRVRRLALGEADLAAELGLVPGPERAELAPLRIQVVLASAVAGLERPVGPVHTAPDDEDGLRRTCRQQYRQGFRGRTAIHPRQVGVINAEFTPAAAEVAEARELLRSFERSVAEGISAFTGEDGGLVDPATVRRAREIVAAAELDAGTG